MARRAYKALATFTTPHGPVHIRKAFAKRQNTWILILEGPHLGLKTLLPQWRPRAASTRTQLSPATPTRKVSDITAWFQELMPTFYARLSGSLAPVATPTTPSPSYSTLGGLLRVVEQEAATSLRASSLETYRHQWDALLRVIDPGLPLSDITRALLQEAMGKLGKTYRPTTVKCLRTALSKLMTRAMEDGALVKNPLELVKIAKPLAKPQQALTREQRDAVLVEAARRGPQPHMLLALLLFAGLRRREVLSLTWPQIDLEHRTIRLENSADFTTKSGEGRTVPVCRDLFEVLALHRRSAGFVLAPSKQYSGGLRWNFSKILASIATAAGVPWFHCHLARHTFATIYLENGGNLHRLAGYMGHGSVEISALYAHHRPGIGDIEALSSIPPQKVSA